MLWTLNQGNIIFGKFMKVGYMIYDLKINKTIKTIKQNEKLF